MPPPRAAPPQREVVMVEYLNPFCAHCRATHARLESVLASGGVAVRRRRVYVWSGEIPFWARACACAAQQGREEALFEELLQARGQDERSVRAAARRAGIDLDAAAGCLDGPMTNARLERDRRLVAAARLEGLPTIDVGRRRLMGEQTEGELLDALHAARVQ
jgi:protein-disulfide isomerase